MLFNLEEYTCIDLDADKDQRYTPDSIVKQVDWILNGIGLDPTSDPRRRVPALNHITEAQNCFTTDWKPLLSPWSTVFMNPPYSNTAPFLARMAEYLESGAITAAVTLTLAGVLCNKSTQRIIKNHAVAICHPFGRINFVGGGGSNDRDVVFILWGKDASLERFKSLNGLISVLEP